MAMTPIYQHPLDNVASTATITVQSGTEDTDYPVAYLTDNRITRPAKLTTTTGAFQFEFLGSQRLDLFALGPHNLTGGLSVKLQGHTSATWGSPAFSADVVIPTVREDGVRPMPFLDLTTATGYSAGGFRYWRLVVVGTNAAPIAIGEVWMSAAKRTFTEAYRWSYEVDEERFIEEHVTEYGMVIVYDLQIRKRRFRASFPASDATVAEITAWHRAMKGRVYGSLFIPNDSTNDAWWVVLPKDWTRASVAPNFHDIQIDIEELAQGLPL